MADKRVLLAGGSVVDPAAGRVRRLDVLIADGVIAEVGGKLSAPGANRVDLRGRYIAPGFVDMHCHLREPGYEEAETIETGTRAALAGGFTRVCPMPNTDPPVDTEAMVRFQIQRGDEAGYCHVHPVGCCTKARAGRELAEIGSMVQSGAVAVSDDGAWVADPMVMRRVLEYAKAFDVPVISHCELAGVPGVANEGLVSTRLGLAGQSYVAETAAAARDIMLAEAVGARLHIAHVSCAATVELVRWARGRGVPVTAEACPHHFTLTEDALGDFDTNCRVNPPLRTEADRQAVIGGIVDGTIEVIATDHAPHTRERKEVEFDNAAPGMTGFETAFSLGFEQLVLPGLLTIPEYVARLTVGPARILGLPVPRVEAGVEAELVFLDPKLAWTYTADGVMSRSRNSPFIGRGMKGMVVGGMLGDEQFWLLHQD